MCAGDRETRKLRHADLAQGYLVKIVRHLTAAWIHLIGSSEPNTSRSSHQRGDIQGAAMKRFQGALFNMTTSPAEKALISASVPARAHPARNVYQGSYEFQNTTTL